MRPYATHTTTWIQDENKDYHLFCWTWVDGETEMNPPAGTPCKCGKTVWEEP